MKTINLYFKFAFTSLSKDAQPISLGIVSDEFKPCDFPELYDDDKLYSTNEYKGNKSFYAEFTDFDINHCDDWVKENVVSKMRNAKVFLGDEKYPEIKTTKIPNGCWAKKDATRIDVDGDVVYVKKWLKTWLNQFYEYEINFIMDCSYLGAMWIMELLDERVCTYGEDSFDGNCPTCGQLSGAIVKSGLPQLPSNVCPIPNDLNSLIAQSKKTSIRGAFNLDRGELANHPALYNQKKFNALYDATIIRDIYLNMWRGIK